jgi:hypothetical protein
VEGDSLHQRATAPEGEGSPLRDLGTSGGNDDEDEEESRLAFRRGNTGSMSGCRDSNGGLLLM